MKFYQSTLMNNFRSFLTKGDGPLRCPSDAYLIWKYFEYFRPKTALEIGFYAGQTMAIMAEAGSNDIDLISIEIEYDTARKNNFLSLFPKSKVTFNEISSIDYDYKSLKRKMDFVVIDGDHTYDFIYKDILNCLQIIDHASVLYLDEAMMPDIFPQVRSAIDDILLKNDWVPFLAGQSGMFFCHASNDLSNFLDKFIQHKADRMFYFDNEFFYYDNRILSVRHPMIFEDNDQIFTAALKYYDL